jgi:hypothetical protein
VPRPYAFASRSEILDNFLAIPNRQQHLTVTSLWSASVDKLASFMQVGSLEKLIRQLWNFFVFIRLYDMSVNLAQVAAQNVFVLVHWLSSWK